MDFSNEIVQKTRHLYIFIMLKRIRRNHLMEMLMVMILIKSHQKNLWAFFFSLSSSWTTRLSIWDLKSVCQSMDGILLKLFENHLRNSLVPKKIRELYKHSTFLVENIVTLLLLKIKMIFLWFLTNFLQ